MIPNTTASCSSSTTSSRRTTVSKNYFPIDKKIDIALACAAFGTDALAGSGKERADPEQLQSRLFQVRKDAATWGTQRIKGQICQYARSKGIECSTFKGLVALWKKDSSEEFAAKLWFACYGAFDLAPKWEEDLEEEYMDLLGYQYDSESEDDEENGVNRARKGCFARLFSHCKNDIIKGLNRATIGAKGHGGTIRMKMTKEEADAARNDEKLKNKKRKKGHTKGNFFSLASKESSNPAKVLKRMEDSRPIPEGVSHFCSSVSFEFYVWCLKSIFVTYVLTNKA
jgi:hypothetical protein